MENKLKLNTILLVIIIILLAIGLFYIVSSNSKQESDNLKQDPLSETQTQTQTQTPIPKSTPKPQNNNLKMESITVSMPLNDFKKMCSDADGEYVQGVNYGIAPIPYVLCGYNKASDANRLCESENQSNSCSSCTYGSSCGPAAGDFGPTHCYCSNYKIQKVLSPENIPNNL